MNNQRNLIVACGAIFLFAGTLVFLYLKRDTVLLDFSSTLEDARRTAETIEHADRVAAMQDTNGGTSPEDVLRLYREAVGAGDFDRAARYFIADKQSKELEYLQHADSLKRAVYIKRLGVPAEKKCEGINCTLVIKLDGPDYFMRFIQYPNQLWKIVEL